MANVYVYRHLSGGNNSRGVGLLDKRLYNGQLIFFTGEVREDPGVYSHLFYYWDYDKNKFETNFALSTAWGYPRNGEVVNNAGDRIYTLPHFNRTVYGSRYAHSSDGSIYSLRSYTMLQKPNSAGDDWITHHELDANYRVIIGGGQGYTFSNNASTSKLVLHKTALSRPLSAFNRVRCWGYIRPNGTVVETNGLYVYVNYITNNPGDYALHTR